MHESRKDVLRQTGIVAVGQLICTAVMIGVFVLVKVSTDVKYTMLPVILGGIVGSILAVGNFFSLALVATVAADRAERQDLEGAQKLIKGSYPIRLLVLAGLLVLCAITDWFHILALVLPLAFVRISLSVYEFFRKKGG